MHAVHSMIQAWAPRAERCCPKLVLERISQPSWSGLWRETDHPSPSALRMISPDPTPDPVPSPPSPHCSPLLEDALQCPLLEDTHPPTHSCLLYRCRLAAPLLALSPPSMRCKLGRTAILQRRHGRSFPRLRLRGPDSASAHWPAGSTMAPSSLLSAVAHLPIGSAGLPRSSSSALVWRRPSYTSGLLRLRFVPLVPSGSFIPSAPPQSSVAPAPPQPSGFPSLPWSPGSSLDLGKPCHFRS